jgi:hypothetical protein
MSDPEIQQMIAEAIQPLQQKIADLERRLSWLENPQLRRDAEVLADQEAAAKRGDPDFQNQAKI